MKHLGDITKINGAEIEAVDVITGGSPCQDLSIAGKRAGLAGARSGLCMEQVRIVKEMREHDRKSGRTGDMVRPRFMVWENVPGAFSSNKGRDFAAVLEEIIRIAEPEAPDIDVPEKGWPTWGGYHDEVGGRWSVAWRVHDAQYWGVPQRRRRISVVADFGGDTAGEILFERKSVSGHPAESGAAGERLAGTAENGASYAVRIRGGCDGGGKGALVQTEKSGMLGTGNDQTIFCLQGNAIDRADTAGCNGKGWREDVSYTLNTIDRPAVCAGVRCLTPWEAQSARVYDQDGVWHSLNANENGGMARDSVLCAGFEATPINLMVATRYKALGRGTGFGGGRPGDPANTISSVHSHGVFVSEKQVPTMNAVCAGFKLGNSEQARSIGYAEEQSPTLNAECGGNKPAVLCLNDQGGNVMGVSHDVSGTLRAQEHGHQPSILDMSHACDVIRDCGEVAPSLQARMGTGGNQVPLTYQDVTGTLSPGAHAGSYNGQDAYNDMLVCGAAPDVAHALRAKASCAYREDAETYPVQNMVVRRLTPLECERLQGFPDGWTDIGEWYDSQTGDGYWVDSCGKRHKTADSPRYKALGNSIALPFWDFLAKRISAQYLRPVTMGSLFDGIGGFPLVFERHNGKGTARWASEIEEFPIAVTKKWFGEE
jgi:DNA (cytosine-5)-methyltransferase 1|nr:MAG TPA: Cytosine specific methyltransferase [Caudoviricetes sp.]